MSRIIVKNLPKKVNEQQLKDHFSALGSFTDFKLKYKSNGEFKGYAFIGFDSEEKAEEACRTLHNTCYKTCKIEVQRCKEKHIGNKSKQVGESPIKEEEKDEEKNNNNTGIASNPEISDLEYLQNLKSSKGTSGDTKIGESKIKKWGELFTVVIRTNEQNTNKKKKGRTFTKPAVKAFIKPCKCKTIRIPRNVSYVAYVGFKEEKEMQKVLIKDKSFLDGVRVRVHKYEKADARNDNCSRAEAPWSAAEEKLKAAAPVAESGKIFVRNLWYSVTEENLKEFFEKIGPLTDVTLPICKLTRKPKGFAHISFVFPEHAVKAMNELDGTNFQGRVIHILPSLLNEDDEEDNDEKKSSFKENKLKEQKKTASSWHNWNSLFLGSSAVIDLMVDNFGQSKQALFDDANNKSTAVNLALGEAQYVEETKRFLEDEGVSLEVFSKPNVPRSSTVLLAKNLPARTTAKELEELFGKYGELGRVVLPPSGVTAILEFLDPSEAKIAFRELAYSRFKYLPLYLEWAPTQTFKLELQRKNRKPLANNSKEEKCNPVNATEATTRSPDSNTTLYVKNLNFETDEESIKKHFSTYGEVLSVLIAKRNNGLSQGYGFVQFMKSAEANKALKQLQEKDLDGHKLIIKLSEKKLISEVKTTRKINDIGKQISSKIHVKNIPFQATTKEIRQLFQTFGELKSVRLPMKPDNTEHRGFGFVHFVTKEDAKKAFDSLSLSNHLYGRRLVLEWAKDDETVDELRRRTAEHFLNAGTHKKMKMDQHTSNKNGLNS